MFARCLDGFFDICPVASLSLHIVGLLALLHVVLLTCLPVGLLFIWHDGMLPLQLRDVLPC